MNTHPADAAFITPHRFNGIVRVPASKSHTIRRLIIATLAAGISEIENPLDSLDTRSCVSVCRALGAEIETKPLAWIVRGSQNSHGGLKRCHVGNSGTTLFFALAVAALGNEPVEFDGDEQIRRRSAGPLLEALTGLGGSIDSAAKGYAPITVRGPLEGGRVSLPCPTSQYLSALLLAAPLAPDGVVTEIDIPLLNEKPYIDMTLSYLDSQGIPYIKAADYSYFNIPGGSAWKPSIGQVPGDFSSAVFPAAAAVISGGSVTLLGLDPEDRQGDKAFFNFLEKMGCIVHWKHFLSEKSNGLESVEWQLTVSRDGPIVGGEFDLNDTPDLFPVMAAAACFAQGDTVLMNVASARLKETDRIAVMAEELVKLGVKTTERADGLVIHGEAWIHRNEILMKAGSSEGKIRIDGRGDHRVVMAFACIALGCPLPMEIAGAECASVTYPGFWEMLEADLLI
jgi:3-phosphoshikimate 1-carboxyvinyltransferase